jgi:dTDP-4-dehydrorhamnose 3,5-epimerase-like enzyme
MIPIMEIKKYHFPPHGDDRGQLIAIEALEHIPFEVKRVYYIYDTLPGVRRGFHAHRNLEQILICVSGSCMIHLDNGYETQEVLLNSPAEGLYIANDMWREMYDFSKDAVLLVLASEKYDEADYIRNYDTFMDMIRDKEEKK